MLQLSGLPADAPTPPLSMLTAHKTNSALKDSGSVTTDNPVLNWIVHAARMSVTDVLQSIGMDVPDRERLGWLGDVSQYSEAAMRMLDATAFFENQLRTAHSSKERRRPLFWRPFWTVTEPAPGLLAPLSGILASRRRKPRKNEKKRGKNGRDMA